MTQPKNLSDVKGGKTAKQNYTAITYGNDKGSIGFGVIHQAADVTSSVILQTPDANHSFFLDGDGERKGWTTSIGPGNFQVECGSANKAAEKSTDNEKKRMDLKDRVLIVTTLVKISRLIIPPLIGTFLNIEHKPQARPDDQGRGDPTERGNPTWRDKYAHQFSVAGHPHKWPTGEAELEAEDDLTPNEQVFHLTLPCEPDDQQGGGECR